MTKLNYVIIWFSNLHNIDIDNVLFCSLKNAVQQWWKTRKRKNLILSLSHTNIVFLFVVDTKLGDIYAIDLERNLKVVELLRVK